jgi:SAM-dependent methyltransferase
MPSIPDHSFDTGNTFACILLRYVCLPATLLLCDRYVFLVCITITIVIDTFGLCSFENPREVLTEMQRVVKHDGRILLLEHGMQS